MDTESAISIDRREFVKLAAVLIAAGSAGTVASDAAAAEGTELTVEALAEAQKITGLTFTPEELKMMLAGVKRNVKSYEELRGIDVPNSVPPAGTFFAEAYAEAVPIERAKEAKLQWREPPGAPSRPGNPEDIAYLSIPALAALMQSRKLSPVELAEIHLDRLKLIGPKLNCVVTLMEEQGLAQARRAEAEIKAGRIRGPLHGVTWGAKDLLATRGVRTTWGAKPYENQMIAEDATVVRKLDEAGAVLLAKLSLGELAMGDLWFGGRTNNPWNLERGSSGSSAGPAAATAAGLVAFAIGSETLGSIVSPCGVCGVTGLRPTFGRVSRAGAMALSWSMDKLGPIARSAEDCALVLSVIHGADPADPSSVSRPFPWPERVEMWSLRIGYLKKDFDAIGNEGTRALHDAVFKQFEKRGAKLVPFELPKFPVGAMRTVLSVEAATAFDDLTRSGRDDLLRAQQPISWPNTFRTSRLVPAVEYLRAQRVRTLLMRAMRDRMRAVDLFLAPSFFGDTLTLTNLTGHPCVAFPIGFQNGMPAGMTLVGQLFDEAKIVSVVQAYQDHTDWNTRPPNLG